MYAAYRHMTETDHRVRSALAGELASWLGPGAILAGAPTKLGGGESSDCYRFDVAEPPSGVPAALVLRLMREDEAAAHECAVQAAVAAQGFPAPRIAHTGSSASAFGRPFSIMAFVAGRDPVADGALRRLPQTLAEAMRDLHALSPDGLKASVRASGADPRQMEIGALIDEFRRSLRTEIARGAHWFDDKGFDPHSHVLCHGDLHARNLLMENGSVVAVLDWEIALFAPREFDVARTELLLRLMPGVGVAAVRPLVRLLGRRVARQFLANYASCCPLDAVVLDRCRALHALRLVALLRTRGAAADGVRRLWQPFERELALLWTRLTDGHL
jgi:aminoglycoside phosphotransferase (APT) family kinase protein